MYFFAVFKRSVQPELSPTGILKEMSNLARRSLMLLKSDVKDAGRVLPSIVKAD